MRIQDAGLTAVVDGLAAEFPALTKHKSYFMYNAITGELFIKEPIGGMYAMQRISQNIAPKGTIGAIKTTIDEISVQFGSTTRAIDDVAPMLQAATNIITLKVTDSMRAKYNQSAQADTHQTVTASM